MLLLPLFLIAVQAAPATAPGRVHEPVCIRAGDLPSGFAAWNRTAASRLTIGQPYLAAGVDRPRSTLATTRSAARPGKSASARFTLRRAGVYRIGLSEGAWIDVVQGRRTLQSVAHGHGPICTGLRKIVDFKLSAGSYALQLAGMPSDSIKVMIVRK